MKALYWQKWAILQMYGKVELFWNANSAGNSLGYLAPLNATNFDFLLVFESRKCSGVVFSKVYTIIEEDLSII